MHRGVHGKYEVSNTLIYTAHHCKTSNVLDASVR